MGAIRHIAVSYSHTGTDGRGFGMGCVNFSLRVPMDWLLLLDIRREIETSAGLTGVVIIGVIDLEAP